jgi:maltooligosyltrehalose trehalohydrolase
MHIGTFTREGTWQAAAEQLPELAALGITVVEVMPVSDFPGQFGWGYDGVNLFAPTRLYGAPDDFRAFVNRAHEVGLGVILDVVYNHIGPDGNYLPAFSASYFANRHKTDWGQAINFDGDDAGPVREFYLTNAAYWISEFHLDGFRLDATQDIHDESPDHILAGIARAVRKAAGKRGTIIVAENEQQKVCHVLAQEHGGYGLDGMWNDDFHHAAHVALSGHREAYYSDYFGTPQEIVSALKHGFLYQGQRSAWQENPRGTPARGLPPETFVTFLQNHDQVANSLDGRRCNALASPGRYRAMTAVMLLGPGTPLLFQGQEFASSSPFLFFADHHPELAKMVREGRKEFLSQFPSLAVPEVKEGLPDPSDPATFERCKLDFAEREAHAETYRLHRDLLRLRSEDPAFRSHAEQGIDGAVLAEQAFVMRFFGTGDDDRLLLANLGSDLALSPASQPLLAPPPSKAWEMLWSSEEAVYGGSGTAPVETDEGWKLPGQAAVVLKPTDPRS